MLHAENRRARENSAAPPACPQGRRVPGFAWLHPHLRSALVQCATQTTLLVQVAGRVAGSHSLAAMNMRLHGGSSFKSRLCASSTLIATDLRSDSSTPLPTPMPAAAAGAQPVPLPALLPRRPPDILRPECGPPGCTPRPWACHPPPEGAQEPQQGPARWQAGLGVRLRDPMGHPPCC